MKISTLKRLATSTLKRLATSTLIRLATYIGVGVIIFVYITKISESPRPPLFCKYVFLACWIALCVELLVLAYKTAYRSHKTKTRGRIYATVIRGGARRVEDVASVTGLPYDVVQKDLRKFAKKGKGDFQGAYFNEATQEIIFTRNVPAATRNNAPTNAAPPVANWNNAPANAPAPPVANWNNVPANAPAPPVANWNNAPANAPAQPAAPRNVCPACGASVARVGNGVCEYCGTPLN